MNMFSTLPVQAEARAPVASTPDTSGVSILTAATLLLPHLERGTRIDATILRAAMESAFFDTDAAGRWDWKTAYDAGEAATVLFLRKHGPALFRRATNPAARLRLLDRIAALLPTHTRRSEESRDRQQFSTPIGLGLAAATAAAVTPDDLVLEPSAGTGLLAIFAELAGAGLALDEFAATRAGLLAALFPETSVTRFDAAQIDDHLDPGLVPTVVLMNPPFSALAEVEGRVADAAARHVASALARLAPSGRLVTITGAGFAPDHPTWAPSFARLQERGRVVFSAAVDGAVYARHGTTMPTRLTVIDKAPADDRTAFPPSPGMAPDVATLLAWIAAMVPPRLAVEQPAARGPRPVSAPARRAGVRRPARVASAAATTAPDAVELGYEVLDAPATSDVHLTDAVYEPYTLQAIRVPGAEPHPTPLVQSASMASVLPPRPSYRPLLPATILGLLSDAQLETVIAAGEAHAAHLAGDWSVDATFDRVTAAADGAEGAVRFRQGFMIGDGTGVGKGRQAAAILLDSWLRGRRKAVWISKSDKLIEDAQRDWAALGMERLLVTPLSRFPQGRPIALGEGILFTTYATLRSDGRGEKVSRVRQIVDWLGADFDGVIVFDEAHSMQNAAGGRPPKAAPTRAAPGSPASPSRPRVPATPTARSSGTRTATASRTPSGTGSPASTASARPSRSTARRA